jgi:hypothetical protein
LRISITGAMLTSLKVVRIAAVDCDWTSRSATRWRRRDIGTRCSGRPDSSCSTSTGGGGCCNGALGAEKVFPEACSTSPLVTRPSRPVPWIAEVSTPLSAAIFCAAGMTGGGVLAFSLGSSRFSSFLGEALASVSIWAMTSPEPTASRLFFRIFTRMPSAGAGSSSTTLSVSMSIRFSSRATFSPSFLCQSSSVASATDSDSCGTFTSMIIAAPVRFFPGFR